MEERAQVSPSPSPTVSAGAPTSSPFPLCEDDLPLMGVIGMFLQTAGAGECML